MCLFLLLAHLVSFPTRPEQAAYQIPYRLTGTNHIVLRAKLNGSGPYNFIMDTGAPSLFVAEDVAKSLGIKPDAQRWGVVDRLEIEGGAVIEKIKGRVEGPFQLQTMNQLALIGVPIHGVIGYNVLARFRIAVDMTQPNLTWTRLNYHPPPPAVVTPADMKRLGQPVQNQKQLEAMAKMATAMFARKPQEVVPRGFLGVELGDATAGANIRSVLARSPAAEGGLIAGDVVTGVSTGGKELQSVRSGAALTALLNEISPDEMVKLAVNRAGFKTEVSIKVGKGGL